MRNFLLILNFVVLSACRVPLEDGISDPFEASNRQAHEINKSIDKNIIRPMALVYGDITPIKLQSVANNMSMNFSLPRYSMNYILQGELMNASRSSMKFLVNSTLGVGGIYDFSSQLGLTSEKTDFGETMAKWGFREGPYLEILVLGPSNQRDGIGKVVDLVLDPVSLIGVGAKSAATATSVAFGLSARSQFRESIDSILYESADSYAQSRLFFLQNRRYELGTNKTEHYIDPYN
ncbi:MAG: VacJ family lipoprotein [Rhodobacterales bacterium]|nr:VacJ family lipoprotein [Rhodobacterales bacterium]